MKRIVSFLLTFLLLFTSAAAAFAASSDEEAMRLSGFSGTVTVKNASGITLRTSKSMVLYNGYTVETGAASTAQIRLDESKEITLDSRSICSVRHSGKTAETFLIAGMLFFRTERPLESDETFLIRSHELVNSVRGSCGWQGTDEIGYLHGSGIARTVSDEQQLQGGQMVSLAPSSGSGMGSKDTKKLVDSKLDEDSIPLIVLSAIEVEPQLLGDGGVLSLDLEAMLGHADEIKAERAAEEKKAAQAVQAALRAQNAAMGVNEPVYPAGSSAQAQLPAMPAQPEANEPSQNMDGSGNPKDSQALMARLAGGNATLSADGGWTISYSGVTVGAGQELNITGTGTVSMPGLIIEPGGAVNVAAGARLSVSGTDLVWRGTLTNNGTVESSAEIALVGGDARIVNNGSFVNNQILSVGPGASFTGGTVENAGTVIVANGGGFDPDSANGIVIRDDYNYNN